MLLATEKICKNTAPNRCQDINLQVRKGQKIGLVGPMAAAKRLCCALSPANWSRTAAGLCWPRAANWLQSQRLPFPRQYRPGRGLTVFAAWRPWKPSFAAWSISCRPMTPLHGPVPASAMSLNSGTVTVILPAAVSSGIGFQEEEFSARQRAQRRPASRRPGQAPAGRPRPPAGRAYQPPGH